MMIVKKGTQVKVISGKDKGKNGKVLKILKNTSNNQIKAIVEGINIVKKHKKQSATSKGGIESIEMPIYLSKISLLDPKTSKPATEEAVPSTLYHLFSLYIYIYLHFFYILYC